MGGKRRTDHAQKLDVDWTGFRCMLPRILSETIVFKSSDDLKVDDAHSQQDAQVPHPSAST